MGDGLSSLPCPKKYLLSRNKPCNSAVWLQPHCNVCMCFAIYYKHIWCLLQLARQHCKFNPNSKLFPHLAGVLCTPLEPLKTMQSLNHFGKLCQSKRMFRILQASHPKQFGNNQNRRKTKRPENKANTISHNASMWSYSISCLINSVLVFEFDDRHCHLTKSQAVLPWLIQWVFKNMKLGKASNQRPAENAAALRPRWRSSEQGQHQPQTEK